ncbi:MAG: hypothetical protein P8M19_05305 [Crocinitomicaceae bacterium]|nr:hypothetical protein [Crocinitomicaceae bacterium]
MILLLTCTVLSDTASAQYMEFEWSDEFRYTNKKTGFFREYVGRDMMNIYVLQRNINKSKPYKNVKIMLVSMNKNSLVLTEEERLPLKGFPENAGQEEVLKSLDYVKTILSEGKIFVFWRKLINTDSTRKEEIYAQTFKSNFKPDLPLKKVFEFIQNVDEQASIFDPTMCLVLTEQETDRIVVGTERFADHAINFQYVTVDSRLAASTTNTVLLPQKPTSYPGETTSTYELTKDGLIHVRSEASYTKDELLYMDSKHAKTFPVLTVVNVESGATKSLEFRTDLRTITDFCQYSAGGKTRVVGFFGDLTEDTTGRDNQGLFYADIDPSSSEKTDLNFVYFTRPIVSRIFPKKRMRKKKGVIIPEDEVFQTRFDIQNITSMPDSSLVFFFTEQYNYEENTSRSDLNGENIYSSKASCKNSNVSALRLSATGEIMWARSIDRKITYQGTDIKDVRVVNKYGKFFVLFGNEDTKLSPPKGKRFQHLTEELTYFTFNPSTGRAKEYTTPVNEPKTDRRDMRYLDPNSAIVIDNQIYFNKIRVRQNPLWTVTNVICPPTIFYSVLTGNTKVGKADFAMMRIMDGKRPRKR